MILMHPSEIAAMRKFFTILYLSFLGFGFPCLAKGMAATPTIDTVKYQGYRLDLLQFEVLKRNDTWIKIRFTAINSGRENIDFKQEQTAHWVQVNYDPSLFDHHLGGFRENIKFELARRHFTLKAGEIKKNVELKFPTQPPSIINKEVIAMEVNEQETGIGFSEKGGEELQAIPEREPLVLEKEPCPDILFTKLKIAEQNGKSATLEYTILNQGPGSFRLFGATDGVETNLVLRAYISGVPVLSKGALSIGGQFVQELPGRPAELLPGQSFNGKIQIDVRKKTRYMKSLILSLDSNQFALECDRTNNTGAVILD